MATPMSANPPPEIQLEIDFEQKQTELTEEKLGPEMRRNK